MKLLGDTINIDLKFDKHGSTLCSKANRKSVRNSLLKNS